MKTKLVKNITSYSLFACALVSLIAATASGQGRQVEGTPGGRIQGTWDVTVRIINCQTGGEITHFASMLTYHPGGTLMESTSGLPQALKTPGEGVWRLVAGNTYAVRFKFFTFNTQNVFTGWRIVNAEIALDQSGDSYEGSGTQETYDANGNLIGTGCVSPLGTRFEL